MTMICKGKINRLHKHTDEMNIPTPKVEQPVKNIAILQEKPASVERSLYRFPDEIKGFTKKQHYEVGNNVIDILVKLKQENRPPTEEEKAILVSWQGFAFENSYQKDAEEEKIKKRLSTIENEEYLSAILKKMHSSVIDAPLPKSIVEGTWKILEKVGANPSRVAGYNVGTGSIFGYMPDSIRQEMKIAAAYNWHYSPNSEISRHLFPDIAQFTSREDFPDNYFDTAVAVSFAKSTIMEEACEWNGDKILDYLQDVKPGGFLAFITINEFLDADGAKGEIIRKKIAREADLVCAYRIPAQDWWGRNDPLDLIVFRKKTLHEYISDDEMPDWVSSTKIGEGEKIGKVAEDYPINNYFLNHQENILAKSLDRKKWGWSPSINIVPYDEPFGQKPSQE